MRWINLACVPLALWPAEILLAVEPSGELGKVTARHERRAVGREERGNTFRLPGSVLETAQTAAPLVAADELAARQRALYAGETFSNGPAPVGFDTSQGRPSPESVEPVAMPNPALTASKAHAGGALLALVGLGVAGVIVLMLWLTHRRQTLARVRANRLARSLDEPQAAAIELGVVRTALPPCKWNDRTLKITMGHRGE
jgi:hypothetical protein